MVRMEWRSAGRGLLGCLGGAAICLALLLLPSGPAGAEGMPPLPHAFYGSVSVEGERAPVGTVVTARVEGQVCGSIATRYPGKYGSDDNGIFGSGVEKLVVQGDLAEGAPIEFYIGTAKAGQTYQFASGEVTRLDLTVGGPSPQETPEPSPSPAPLPVGPPPPATTVTPTPTPTPAPTSAGAVDGIPSPAAFEIADLAVSPLQVEPGQSVDVSVAVTNVGGLEGSRSILLMLDGTAAGSATVTIAPGGVEQVLFPVVADVPGTHVVDVEGLTATFEVKSPAAPATFALDSLDVSPATVRSGETVTCCVTVTNTGDAPGSYIAMLRVDGEAAGAEKVTLAGGESETVVFSVAREAVGSYPIEIGELRGSFTVKEQAAKVSWPLIGGILGAVVIAGVSTVFLVMRRRRAAL